MIEIKQSSASLALVFRMVESSDHITPKTGATPTVTLSKNGGAYAAAAGAVSEVANGLYKVAPNATDSNTLGILALHATATDADPAAMAYAVVANIESDSITAISALTAPDNAGIAAIQAKTDTLPAAPAATGDIPTAAEVAAETLGTSTGSGTVNDALERLNLVATENPVAVIPAPAEDPDLCVCYLDTEKITGVVDTTLSITVQCTSPKPAISAAGRVVTSDSQTVAHVADGRYAINLETGLRYKLTCAKLYPSGKVFTIAAGTSTLDIATA